jgi:hypothetical protein
MHTEETPDTPQTEGQTIPPEEQIIPSGGGPILGQEATEGVHEQGGGEAPTESSSQASDSAPTPEGQTEGVEGEAQQPMAAATGQAKSLAQQNPNPIALAGAFVAGIVIGRMASRWG